MKECSKSKPANDLLKHISNFMDTYCEYDDDLEDFKGPYFYEQGCNSKTDYWWFEILDIKTEKTLVRVEIKK